MFRSATFKLTLWYVAIVMAISLLFSVTLYHVTTNELNHGLQRESQRIYTQFPVFQGDPRFRPAQDYDESVHNLVLRLVGLNLLVLIGAGFSSYWLARRTLEPIEQAHEQQKRFTADVSHELRTPLTALRMESEVALLSNKISAADLRKTLQSNLEEVSKLETLINNLLRLTRLEADRLQQQFSAVSTSAIATNALEQVAKAAEGRNITLEHRFGKFEDVLGDPESLTQLLVILLDNAVKYSHSDSTVKITSKQVGDEAHIIIRDEGIGIEPEALEHIFDRFYRADSSRTKDGTEGFGLGLSIAQMIAEIHNGSITLASQLGKGTTATIALPLAAKIDTDKPAIA